MYQESTRSRHTTAIIALVFSLAGFPAIAQSSDWADDTAEQATSGQMAEKEATSNNPDELTVESRASDGMTVVSETMEGRVEETEDSANMETGSEQMSQHEASSTDFTTLRKAGPVVGDEEILVSGQSEWQATTDPAVLDARKRLLLAQERARNARTVYGDMMERNYPTGTPRIEIVNERDSAMEALEKAKRTLAAAES